MDYPCRSLHREKSTISYAMRSHLMLPRDWRLVYCLMVRTQLPMNLTFTNIFRCLELFEAYRPELVAPMVAVLCHESNTATGGLFESGAGYVGGYKCLKTCGSTQVGTPELVKQNWEKIVDTTNGTIKTFPLLN